ncbi:recombinase family protein [Flavobacterium sp.]|uniref:recombinase family protein n=1 Tax=Flavobacterium sp. TaxID=239 RepID=UPI00374D3BF5
MIKKLLKKQKNQESISRLEDKKFYFGYIRVSSVQQVGNGSLASQRQILRNFGVIKENIYCDVKSGTSIENRSELNKLLKIFNPENKRTVDELKELKIENQRKKATLVVAYLDRLSRSLYYGLNFIKELENLGIQFVALDIPFGTDQHLNQLVLTILMWLAEYQIRNTKERQKIGIKNAILNGKYLMRSRRKLTPDLLEKIEFRKKQGRSPAEIYKTLGISKSSYYTALKLLKKNEKS